MSEYSDYDMKKFSHRMKCLSDSESDLHLWGHYGTASAANLVIAFDKCDNSTFAGKCKSEEEIKDWMLLKYIILGWNSK